LDVRQFDSLKYDFKKPRRSSMKFNTALLLSFCVLPSTLWASEDKQAYQMAFLFCVTDVVSKSDLDLFKRKSADEKANECVERLKNSRPSALEGLDIEKFKSGFFDGRYEKAAK
jgi:hypothetical protein